MTIAALTNAIALNREDADLYRTRSAAYLQERETDAALHDANEAVCLAPDSARSHASRGEALAASGRAAAAVVAFRKALDLDDGDLLRSEIEEHIQDLEPRAVGSANEPSARRDPPGATQAYGFCGDDGDETDEDDEDAKVRAPHTDGEAAAHPLEDPQNGNEAAVLPEAAADTQAYGFGDDADADTDADEEQGAEAKAAEPAAPMAAAATQAYGFGDDGDADTDADEEEGAEAKAAEPAAPAAPTALDGEAEAAGAHEAMDVDVDADAEDLQRERAMYHRAEDDEVGHATQMPAATQAYGAYADEDEDTDDDEAKADVPTGTAPGAGVASGSMAGSTAAEPPPSHAAAPPAPSVNGAEDESDTDAEEEPAAPVCATRSLAES